MHEMIVHQNNHKGIHEYKCKICDNWFDTREYLEIHMTTHGSDTFKCTICNQCFNLKNSLSFHIINSHSLHGYQRFSYFGDKQKESRKCETEKSGNRDTYKCLICDKLLYFRISYIDHHNSTHLGLTIQCDFCETTCTTRSGITTHIRDRHKADILKCCECEYISSSMKDLDTHLDVQHSLDLAYFITGTEFVCLQCEEGFRFKQHLEWHEGAIHHQNLNKK